LTRPFFLKKMRLEKNSENFDILNSHNTLSARRLQKSHETSIYNNGEIGKTEMSLKNLMNAQDLRIMQSSEKGF